MNINQQLQYEDWAYSHGFNNDVEVSLAADFLSGASANGAGATAMAVLPAGITISDSLRRLFVEAGRRFASNDLFAALAETFERYADKVECALSDNHIAPSTGDCRGACQYNVGDRSEYRNYGW